MKNYISENISYLVKKMRCSQDEFGAIFELNRGNVSQYIKEKSQPKIETLQRIAAHFDITLDELINSSLQEIPKENFTKEPESSYGLENELMETKNKIILLLEQEVERLKAENDILKDKKSNSA